MEKIMFAAVKVQGKVFTGRMHFQIINFIHAHYPELDNVQDVQGFVTDNNRFVDRIEAGRIALDSRQITTLKYFTNKLDSGDLNGLIPDEIEVVEHDESEINSSREKLENRPPFFK